MCRAIILTLLLGVSLAAAQTPAPPAPGAAGAAGATAIPIFRATLPGGVYAAAVRNIVSVSTHEYLVDGVARVTEVNVETTGSLLVRFYHLEPQTPPAAASLGSSAVEKAQQLFVQGAEKAGIDAWKKVTKSYPTTTHSRTVEYRLNTKDDAKRIFDAADESFRLQKSKQITIE
jgi:hypothetical protein